VNPKKLQDIHAHAHYHITALFPGLPWWAGARRNLDFMVQRKIPEADTPTIQLGITPIGLISDSDPPPSSPIFMSDALPAATFQFSLAWDRH